MPTRDARRASPRKYYGLVMPPQPHTARAPMKCLECGAVFKEEREAPTRRGYPLALECPHCHGGGPFEELAVGTPKQDPTVTLEHLNQLRKEHEGRW